MDNASETSHSSPDAAYQSQIRRASRTDRPCDTCRRRKSRCVRESGQDKCVLCTFHHRDCTYVDEPQRRKRKRPEGSGEVDGATDREESSATSKKPNTNFIRESVPRAWPNGSVRSLLDQTLGLHRTTHSKVIGASALHDRQLIDLLLQQSRASGEVGGSNLRRVDGQTTFVSRRDSNTLFHSDDDDDLEAIEQIVRPHGPALVHLYFRIVHPSYPILHKGVFLEKYARTYKEFSPPLLAAVYAVAMDWWDYDRELSSKEAPDSARLIKAATKTLTSVIHRPKLSTLQAGLLLLQRSGGDSWPLTSQLVAVGEELGVHLDCSSWNIPDWEKGLRRRIMWAIYMQDKWGALIYGRPSHVSPSNWQTRQLSLEDFPESAADEDDKDGSTEVEKGRYLFMHLTRLTEIMAEALDQLYGLDQSRNHQIMATVGVPGLLELVKPTAMKLKDWASNIPPGLRMDDVKTRKLCSNGYLHLSYFATEIMVHRYIIGFLGAETPPQLRLLCREAATARLDHAMAFVEALRPEHLQGFWWFASSKCLALIGVYGALLWATSTADDESEVFRQKLDDFRWSLKVRAKGSGFLSAAIRELDDCLEGIDFKQSLGTSATPGSSSVTHSASGSRGARIPDASHQDLGHAYDAGDYGVTDSASAMGHFDALDFASTVSPSLFSELDGLDLGFPGLGQS